jgi:hypothetical protein
LTGYFGQATTTGSQTDYADPETLYALTALTLAGELVANFIFGIHQNDTKRLYDL